VAKVRFRDLEETQLDRKLDGDGGPYEIVCIGVSEPARFIGLVVIIVVSEDTLTRSGGRECTNSNLSYSGENCTELKFCRHAEWTCVQLQWIRKKSALPLFVGSSSYEKHCDKCPQFCRACTQVYEF